VLVIEKKKQGESHTDFYDLSLLPLSIVRHEFNKPPFKGHGFKLYLLQRRILKKIHGLILNFLIKPQLYLIHVYNTAMSSILLVQKYSTTQNLMN
jgi:hypothetical protein